MGRNTRRSNAAHRPAGRMNAHAASTVRATRPAFADLEDVFTVRIAAMYLGVCPKTLYRAISRGEFPVTRIGRRILVVKSRLIEFLEMKEAAERLYQIRAAEKAEREAAGRSQLDRQFSEWERSRSRR